MNSKVYIKDWLALKPYDKQTATDIYYLGICNKVKKALISNRYSLLMQQVLSKNDTNMLACFLTSYLEDLISGTNIWRSFVKMHLKMYQKQLPFYELNHYVEEEINVEDIYLLMWYFLNSIQRDRIISPFNEYIIEVADVIIDIFDNVWEYAPENNYLKTFYEIDEHEDDFYVARKLIDTLLFKTYLFYPDSALSLQKLEEEIFEKYKDENLLMYLNENRAITLHNTYTRLLSLKGRDWITEILGQEHSLYNDYLNISKKVVSFFLYKGQDDSTIFLEHVATGMKFDLTKKSFDHTDTLKVVDTILYLGIVKWKDEWWFSGIYFQTPYDAKLVADEKNSLESRSAVNFVDPRTKDNDEMMKNQLSVFKELNNGKQIAFMPLVKINKFIKDYTEAYNNSLKLSKKEQKETIERANADGFFGKTDNHIDFPEGEETGLVFFNEKSGVEVALGINSAFPLSWNPFYNEEESDEHVWYLMTEAHLSKELTMYCIDNCKDKLPFFKTNIGQIYLKDIDFVLRFWKKRNYYSEPLITHTGKIR